MAIRSTFLGMLVILAAGTAFAAETLPGAAPAPARMIPANAVIVLELARPMELLDFILAPALIDALKAQPGWAKIVARPEAARFLQAVKLFETKLATTWRPGLAALAGRGITLAVTPAGNLVIVDGADPRMLDLFNQTVIGLVKIDATGKGTPDPVSTRDLGGVTAWSVGPEEAHACVGNRLYFSNKMEVLTTALALREKSDAPVLATLPAYVEARKAVGPDCAGMVFVNLELLKLNPEVQQGLTRTQEPLGALLFSAATEAVKGSRWLALGLQVQGTTLSARAAVDGATAVADGLPGFTWPAAAGEGALPNLAVPRGLGGLSLYRDLARFYHAKDALFPERTSGIIFFENMMGIFFTGRNFADDVLAQTRPEVRVVLAEQAYDQAAGTPLVRIPAFALVLRMKDPDKFGVVAEEAWQKAIGLVNFTRGQDAQPGLLIDRPVHAGVKLTSASFAPPQDSEKPDLPLRFNFSPSLARKGDFLVMSSTEGLARDCIDALGKETAAPPAPCADTNSLLEIDGGRVCSILTANRENLIRQNMINEGRTREDAEGNIDLFLCIMQRLERAKLGLARNGARPEATLDVSLKQN